jgi:hypothetical protein
MRHYALLPLGHRGADIHATIRGCHRADENLIRTGFLGLFAPFAPCVFANFLPVSRMIGRGGGIENNSERNFKDLEEMQGSNKTLTRNTEERNGILIWPLNGPSITGVGLGQNLAAWMASQRWVL